MRINVESDFWSDPRYMVLMEKMGMVAAAGTMMVLWRSAQKFWIPDKKVLPLNLYAALPNSKFVLAVGLARKVDGGIYVSGTEGFSAWWFQKQEAGRRSAAKRWGNGVIAPLQQTHNENQPPTPAPTPAPIKNKVLKNTTCSSSAGADVRGIWNDNRGSLPECKSVGPKRAASIKARLKQEPGLHVWAALAKYLAASDWHNGQNDRGWTADFDFFISARTMTKFDESTLAGMRGVKPMSKADKIAVNNQEVVGQVNTILDEIDRRAESGGYDGK